MGAVSEQAHLSVFRGAQEQWLHLVATIAAMANTAGGTILVDRVEGDAPLDAAELDERLKDFLEPRVTGVRVAEAGGGVRIDVAVSETRPHVLRRDGVAAAGAEAVFRAGQVPVRREGANAAAGGAELHRMVREAASRLLERLSIGLRDPAFALQLTESAGIPVHLAEDEEAVPVSPNLARLYPYTTKTLGPLLERPMSWVAAAAKVLRLKESRETAYGVPAPAGGVVQWRYSERALRMIQDRLAGDPHWNPYRLL